MIDQWQLALKSLLEVVARRVAKRLEVAGELEFWAVEYVSPCFFNLR